ncbi:MAG TPA: hypothetical protein VMT87_15800 [Vicinamibacteria bacterium]|nr:hypothetical protein [Vicinamibacteria bacterium]
MYALSRGKGVPREAREALGKVRALVEADRARGVSVRLESARIGLEGETRLCAEYEDAAAAARAYARASALVEGVDLVNLVAGPCASGPPPPPGKQEQEEKP